MFVDSGLRVSSVEHMQLQSWLLYSWKSLRLQMCML